MHKITADVTVAGVVIVVFTRWHFEMYKSTMGQIKNTTNDYWGCFLVECVQETCNFLRAHSLRRVYQPAHGWAIIGKLHLQPKMVESNDSLRFKLINCNCFRCKAYSNVVFHCCRILIRPYIRLTLGRHHR